MWGGSTWCTAVQPCAVQQGSRGTRHAHGVEVVVGCAPKTCRDVPGQRRHSHGATEGKRRGPGLYRGCTLDIVLLRSALLVDQLEAWIGVWMREMIILEKQRRADGELSFHVLAGPVRTRCGFPESLLSLIQLLSRPHHDPLH